jgi:serine protease Do
MKPWQLRTLVSLVLFCGLFSAGETNAAEELRYGWRDGETYAYKFNISTTGTDATLNWAGSCSFTVGPAAPDTKVQSATGLSSGTGFVVSPDGMLVTCAHVVKDAKKIEVRLNGKVYDGVVKAVDNMHDVALVRIAARDLPVLTLVDSDKVELNEDVLVVGFPMSDEVGASIKMTRGIISGVIGQKNDKLIQTDAAVNHGNSGGPVVNEMGQVIGIAAAKIERLDVMNVSFIQPSNYVADLLKSQNVTFKQGGQADVLKGSALGKAVVPSVGLFLVTKGPNTDRVERKTLTYKGTSKSTTTKTNGTVIDGQPMTDTGRMVVNREGSIVDSKSDHELPFLMGRICELFVEPFPPGGESKWRWSRMTRVNEVVGGTTSGYAGLRANSGPSTNTLIVHPAAEQATYQLVSSSGDMVTFKKQYEFGTMPKANGSAFLKILGEATFEFDQRVGIMQSMDFTFNYDVNSRRLPVKVSFERVDPKTMKPIVGGLAGGASSGSSSAKAAKAGGDRLAVPTTTSRKEASDLIDDLFKKDIDASKSLAKKAELAKKLLTSAREEKEEPAARYALLEKAKDLAVIAKDLPLAMDVVHELARRFQVQGVKIQAEVIAAINDPEASAEKQHVVAEVAFAAFEEAFEGDDYDTAKQLGGIAVAAARKGRDAKLSKRIADRGRQFKALQEVYSTVRPALETLKTSPADAEANLLVGRFQCFFKEQWQDGLLLLAKGSDPALKDLARKELAGPDAPDAQLAIADGWYEQADRQPAEVKDRVALHASGWYEKALPGLSGLQKIKAEKRVVRAPEAPATTSETASSKPPAAKASTSDTSKSGTAGGAALKQLLARIKEQVKSDRLPRTAEVGFAAGRNNFSAVPEVGALLVGFELTHNGQSFTAIRPIFLGEKGQINGPVYGTPLGEPLKVIAKKGYAVSSVSIREGLVLGGFGICGLTITYMEIGAEGLNAEKSYDTDYIGAAAGNNPVKIGSAGTPVVGIIGHMTNTQVSSLGLVLANGN